MHIKRKAYRKIMSIVLVLAMLLTLIPASSTTAYAAANNISVSEVTYYNNGSLDNITVTFNWPTASANSRMVLSNKSLHSDSGYGDFTNFGNYGGKFKEFDEAIAFDTTNGTFGFIAYTDEKKITYGTNTFIIDFNKSDIPLNIDGTYYVYQWTTWSGNCYPDNLVLVINVKNGVVKYAPATGRNSYNESELASIESNNTYDVSVIPGDHMNKTASSGEANQNGLNTAMTSVVYTADEGYYFPSDYAVDSVNGINVSRDSETQITVYGKPTADTTISLLPATAKVTTLEDVTFNYAYDAQRDPSFPVKDETITMDRLNNPLLDSNGNCTEANGSWTLTKKGTYSYIKSLKINNNFLDQIVQAVADKYHINSDSIVIHELTKNGKHIAYGVVISYDTDNKRAVFLGDTWSDGGCYLLSLDAISYTSTTKIVANATEIATNFVKNISIGLDTSGTYTFPSATTGYTPFTKNVAVSNTGNDNTGALTIALSGDNADSFSLSTTSISDIAVGGKATFAVYPAAGLDAGTYSATVTVSGKEVVSQSFGISFSINSISVQEIEITNPPVKINYAEGEDFSTAGMVVTATYTNNSTANVTSESVVLDGSNLTKGKDTVTVKYTENGVAKTATQSITVGDAILSGVEVTTLPSKTTYKAGDSFDKTGMVVSAIYTNGSKIEVTNYTVINGDSLTSGQDSVTIQYTENGIVKTAILPITVPEASIPVRPYQDNVTVSGSENLGNVKVTADLSKTTASADGVTTSTLDTVTAGKIVDKSVANKSTSIDIKATSGSTAIKTSKVIIPTATIKEVSEKTDASMNIKCDIAGIEFSKEAIDSMASQATGDTVEIIVEKVKEEEEKVQYELKVVCSDGTVISDYKGGSVSVTVSLPSSMADKKLVCVYIDDEGIYHKVDGALNADGTYTFVTDHFSTYAIMAEEEADAVIAKQTAAAQKAAIKKVKATVALSTKNVKKGIRVTVKVPVDQKADKTGIILYRSKKKDSAYAMYKKIETKSSTYIITNTRNVKGNRLTVGKTYYYKARAYKVIDGKTYYGPMSTVKYMKAK